MYCGLEVYSSMPASPKLSPVNEIEGRFKINEAEVQREEEVHAQCMVLVWAHVLLLLTLRHDVVCGGRFPWFPTYARLRGGLKLSGASGGNCRYR
ncbi:hypothetical protein NDU88_002899 [Pleurodeles waltl]|uniref:Uncharacterized protein n=1 Tax=Pleurodeles waltl TaxID=8319 RepID=A0AAV7KW03_PLEWA|nr:hypothetical protein NDU88_002899 [Pleurodeles waltl]